MRIQSSSSPIPTTNRLEMFQLKLTLQLVWNRRRPRRRWLSATHRGHFFSEGWPDNCEADIPLHFVATFFVPTDVGFYESSSPLMVLLAAVFACATAGDGTHSILTLHCIVCRRIAAANTAQTGTFAHKRFHTFGRFRWAALLCSN